MTSAPIVLANRASGDGDDDGELAAWCADHGLELRELGDDFRAAIARAAAERPPFVGVAGGDGTLRCAAEVLAGGGVPLLPIPGGTFNHFAGWLGIADLDAAGRAVTGGATRDVAVATIDGEVFLNTCAIGWYPDMVRTRERLRRRLPRPLAAAAAFAAHAPRLHRFTVELDGTTHLAWLVWAGNGRYGTDAGTVSEREGDDGDDVLDVRLALADRRLAKLGAVWDLLRGRLHDSARLERFVTSTPVQARIHLRRVDAALDAEVVTLRSPLTIAPAARRMIVVVPPGEPAGAAGPRRTGASAATA